MKLLRFATVYLERRDSEFVDFISEDEVDIHVQDLGICGRERGFLFRATLNLPDRPMVSKDGAVDVQAVPRRRSEEAIERTANLLSVLNHTSRRLRSPLPFAALILENDDEREWSTTLRHFHGGPFSIPKAVHQLPASRENLEALDDRLDGLALLAEALNHTHPAGTFHEIVRFFERAFARPFSRLTEKLAQFLAEADLGYDKKEVDSWFKLRNPATHANDPNKDFITFESDVRPVIHRMEQAAYDVLWNKKQWRLYSRERRNHWRPGTATISSDVDVRCTKGEAGRLLVTLLDRFGVFVYDPNYHFSALGIDTWAAWPTDEKPGSVSE